MKKSISHSVAVATALLAGLPAGVTLAQERAATVLEEIVVTARRREERLQDVPISMTVFSQDQLDDRNIYSTSDLAIYTPSMSVNTRFGTDFATFSIRGFHQELRTTASVGTYFAEVVALRGANTNTSGDGAGPGDLFDLENVQVLKGPQGTLFGRNTTGGAVLLVPRRPTDEFEGYIEGSLGNYDMKRAQGVLNVPINDQVRARFGFDHQQRDGYMKNLTDIGPSHLGNVDYIAGRASVVIDFTDEVENYTIFKIVSSDNYGTPGQSFACNPAPPGLGAFFQGPCQAMLADPEASKFHRTFNTIEKPMNKLDQWQVINTLSWDLSDNLTLKNILSYGHLETKNTSSTFGTNLQFPIPPFPGIIPGVPPGGLGFQELIFAHTGTSTDFPMTSQESYVAELQLQGVNFDERLTWQAGLYYEESKPDGLAGARSPGYISCDPTTLYGTSPSEFRCNDLLAAFLPFDVWGLVHEQPYGITYKTQAIFGQATYQITDQLGITAGLRYTADKTKGRIESTVWRFPSNPFTGGYFPPMSETTTIRETRNRSEEPTWLIGLDYNPNPDTLLYAKYSRGYRQGAINIAAPAGLETYDPETVDTYELGIKASFFAPLPGTFSAAVFYNDFQDQALQVGLLPPGEAGTTAIVNIGESSIKGAEIEASVELFEGLTASLSYAYLDTKVKELLSPALDPRFDDFRARGGTVSNANAVQGDPLPFSPEHSFTLSLDYRLPIDPALGDVHVGATYIYSDKFQTTSPTFSPFGVVPSYELLNLHLNWKGIGGSPVDASVFATNVLDEKYTTFVSGNWNSVGFETRYVGLPRMYGVRLRYSF